MKQNRWTTKEIEDLLSFIGTDKWNVEAGMVYASEIGRTYAASQFKWYSEMNKLKNQTLKTTNMTTITSPSGARAHKSWSAQEVASLTEYRQQGLNFDQIADKLHRTRHAIQTKSSKIDVSNRQYNKTTTSRIPIQDYVKMHPEMFDNVEAKPETIPVEAPKQSYQLLRGSELRLKITNIRIEDNELVISL